MRGKGVQLHALLTSVLGGVSSQTHNPAASPPVPTEQGAGRSHSRSDTLEKRRISYSCRESNPHSSGRPVHCPVAIPNNHSRLWPQIKTKAQISTQKFPEMRWSSIIEDAVCRMFTPLLPPAPILRILKRYAHSRVCPHVCTGTLPLP